MPRWTNNTFWLWRSKVGQALSSAVLCSVQRNTELETGPWVNSPTVNTSPGACSEAEHHMSRIPAILTLRIPGRHTDRGIVRFSSAKATFNIAGIKSVQKNPTGQRNCSWSWKGGRSVTLITHFICERWLCEASTKRRWLHIMTTLLYRAGPIGYIKLVCHYKVGSSESNTKGHVTRVKQLETY